MFIYHIQETDPCFSRNPTAEFVVVARDEVGAFSLLIIDDDCIYNIKKVGVVTADVADQYPYPTIIVANHVD